MPKKSRRQRQKCSDAGKLNNSPPVEKNSGLPRRPNGQPDHDGLIKMLADSMVSEQSAYAKAVMDGSIAKRMKPPDFDEKSVAELPQTEVTWFVDYDSKTDIDEDSKSGYTTQVMYKVGKVEKETGSNGLVWTNGPGQEMKCDGLSDVMAFCVEIIDGGHTGTTILCHLDGMLKSVAKACLRPKERFAPVNNSVLQALQPKPSRPRKVLVRSTGYMRELKPKLRRMGIPDVSVAEDQLVSSMRASFASSSMEDQLGAGMFAEAGEAYHRGDEAAMDSILAQSIGASLMRTAEYDPVYVDEERKSLGSWRQEEPSAVPMEWFARPPNLEETQLGYRDRMLWGWRTNLELAVERNDATKIKNIAASHSREHVKDVVEMRILLTKAAGMGIVRSCEALLAPYPDGCGANVDGVLSSTNKRQWRALQIESGDKDDAESQSPLNRAAQHGNTAVVAHLLREGANPNLVNSYQGAGPIHYAVARAHKDCVMHLLKGGPGGRSDIHLLDKNGHSALSLAASMVNDTGQSRFRSILSLLREFDQHGDGVLGGSCEECGKFGAQSTCVCGSVIYCDRTCQKNHWKSHKKKKKATS